MIQETILQELQALFPQTEVAAEEVIETSPEEVEDVEETDTKKSSKKKEPEPPRENGVITRDYSVHGYHVDAQVAPDQLLTAVEIINKNEFFIETITGVDWIKEDELEIIYDFSRYDFDVCRVVIRTRVPRSTPIVPTITGIYSGANWHERETAEFFGIKFDGHPHLIPLLLPEDADFHPLLKDFKV